ncbi:MAG: Asd/ArgC dimerization domain-containing protein, partial [Bacteroidales bacterium]
CPLQPSHQSQPSCPLQPSHQSQPSCQLQPSHQSQPSCPLQPSHQSQPSCPLQPSHRLVANPNCSTIQMVMALAPLHNAFGLQRVVATTYQSVSGSGRKGEKQLNRERAQARQTQLQAKHTQQIQPLHKHAPAPQPQYEYQSENAQTDTAAQTSRQPSSYHANLSSEQISFHLQCRQPSSYHADPASPYHCPIDLNVIPQIGDFLEDGYSEEEHKMIDETKKIFNDSSIGVSATTVRVPVFGAHCVSLNVQLARPFTLEEVHRLLSSFPGLVLTDAPEGPTQLYGPGLRPGLVPGEEPAMKYATPLTAKGTDAIYVSRVRRDPSIENGLELWTVADNIRKGAALNAVQIAEHLLTLKGSK